MADLRKESTYTVYSPISGTVESLKWTGLVASLPTAARKYHDFVATVVVAGSRDRTYRCKKLADNTYGWVEVSGGLGAHKTFTGGDVTIPARYSLVVSRNYEVELGDHLTIEAGGRLEII